MAIKTKAYLKLTVASIAVSMAVLLGACNAGGGEKAASGNAAAFSPQPSKAPKELQTINFAYMPDSGGATPIAVGEEKGYFKEAGIKLNAVKFLNGPTEFQAMASGNIDIAYIGPGATFLAAQGKGQIIGIVSLSKADMVYATKKSGIKEGKDLKGKTVGVPKGTSGEMVLNLGLEKAGLKPSDVNIINLDVAGAVSSFIAGKVDAVAIWAPYTIEIEKQVGKENIVKLGDDGDFYPEYVFPSSWVVNPKFLNENPEAVDNFMKAIAKTTDFKINHKDEAIKLTSAYTQVSEDDLRKEQSFLEFVDNKKLAQAFSDGSAKKWYDNLQKLFVQSGKMDQVVPSENFLYTKAAIKATQQ